MGTPFLGMRGSTGFGADGSLTRRPENWREMLLMLYPNGSVPLTAMMSQLSNEKTDDPVFHWFEKVLDAQRGAITGIYSNSTLATAVTAGAIAAGVPLYAKMALATLDNFKIGHVVLVRASGTLSSKFSALITDKTANGANSYLSLKVTEAYTVPAGPPTYNVLQIIGTAYPEGDSIGSSISYDPTEKNNYTQIFRNSIENTRTAARTRLRTGDAITQAKKEALELHGIEMERAFLLNGAKYVTTGTNGQPLRITAGCRNLIQSNLVDWTAATGQGSWANTAANAMTTWQWLNNQLEVLFRYGSPEKIAFCGSGAILGIQNLLSTVPSTRIELTTETKAYGISVMTLNTAFGTLYLKNHPLMTLEATMRNEMAILDTKFLTYRYVDDTQYLPERQANDLDGVKSEYLTEAGLELHFEQAHGWFSGIGLAPAS
jgi:hypothetical protein